MSVVYPTLVGEIAKRGIKKSVIATRLGISPRSLYNKMNGKVSFTWEEVCTINSCFFPDLDLTLLFTKTSSLNSGESEPQCEEWRKRRQDETKGA